MPGRNGCALLGENCARIASLILNSNKMKIKSLKYEIKFFILSLSVYIVKNRGR